MRPLQNKVRVRFLNPRVKSIVKVRFIRRPSQNANDMTVLWGWKMIAWQKPSNTRARDLFKLDYFFIYIFILSLILPDLTEMKNVWVAPHIQLTSGVRKGYLCEALFCNFILQRFYIFFFRICYWKLYKFNSCTLQKIHITSTLNS